MATLRWEFSRCQETYSIGIANYYLEAGQGIEYVADHLGHKNIQNTKIYAQITTSLRQEVFAKLERHPKIVRVA